MYKRIDLKIALVALLLLIGVSVRFAHVSDHFTHVDSVFMIMDILKAKDPGFKDSMMERAFDPERPAYNSMYKKTLRYLGSKPKYEPLLNIAFKLSPFFIISVTGANPPLQFVANVPLINEAQNYRQLLFWGRFPSFVYSVLVLFAFIYLLSFLDLKKDYWLLTIISLSFLCFSWQSIIYAKQVYQYSLNALTALLMLLSFVQVVKGKNNWTFSAIVPILLYYLSYQVLWLLPAFYLTLFIIYYQRKDWVEIKRLIMYASVVGLFVIPSLIYNLLHFVGYSTKYYQIGTNGEFLFQPGSITGFIAKIIYIIKFFILNSFITYRANIVPYPVETMLGSFLSVVYFALFLCGIYAVWNDKNKLIKHAGWFIFISFIVLFISNLTGQMPLTPCRLSLFYLSFFVFLTAYGVLFLIKKYLPEKKQFPGITIITLVIVTIFAFSYPRVMHNRLDPISEEHVTWLINKYDIQTVVSYNFSQNIHLMTKLIKEINYYEDDFPRPSPKRTKWEYEHILYFSTRTPYGEEQFYDLQRRINADKSIKEKWKNSFNEYQVVYNYRYDTDVQVEYTKDNPNPTNDLYLTVIRLK